MNVFHSHFDVNSDYGMTMRLCLHIYVAKYLILKHAQFFECIVYIKNGCVKDAI